MLLLHVVASTAALLLGIANLVVKSRSVKHDAVKVTATLLLSVFSVSSGAWLVVEGANIVQVCLSGSVLLAFVLYSVLRVYRTSQFRIEL